MRVFHTFFRRRVTPIAERTPPMWMYNGPTDLDHALPEELPNDEVCSRLDWVLQLRSKETNDGKPRPLHAMKLSKLVCSPLLCVLFPFCSPVS